MIYIEIYGFLKKGIYVILLILQFLRHVLTKIPLTFTQQDMSTFYMAYTCSFVD